MWGGADEAEAIRAIHVAIDMGVNLIDTAAIYGFGASEELVGKAIADRRQRVVIATKCGLVWDGRGGEHFFDSEGKRIHRYLAAESIRLELEDSLRRLRVDTIDLYPTHRQDPSTPIAETMETLLALQREGKVRAIGVSNASAAQMEQYRALGPLDTDQESYSMLSRAIEADQLPYCRAHGIAMLAYSPMARGLLTGKVGPERVFAPGDHRAEHPLFTTESRVRVATLLARCLPVARRHDATPGQLAIAWALAQPGITHALVGARDAVQTAENVAAADIALTADDLRAIDAALADVQA
jgi:aryl-alcohol dehydrogenase-like predicted oxidoreductase